MRSFLTKCLLFCLPFGILYGTSFAIMSLAREFVTVDDAIETQRLHPEALVLDGYGNDTNPYKVRMTMATDPDIIVLGTSRMMEFRAPFFATGTRFYNVGGMSNAADLLGFIRRIPRTSRLRTIIVGIDPRFLQLAAAPAGPTEPATRLDRYAAFLGRDWRVVYSDYAAHKFTFGELWRRNRSSHDIGMIALAQRRGYRADGSRDYGPMDEGPSRLDALRTLIKDTATDIRTTGRGSEYDDAISQEHLASIRSFLEECRLRGIHVVGILPPAPAPLLDALASLTDARGETFRSVPGVLADLFHEENYPFFDLSSLKTIGASENEMIDIQHTTEKGSLRMLGYLADHDADIARTVSTTTIKDLLARPGDIHALAP